MVCPTCVMNIDPELPFPLLLRSLPTSSHPSLLCPHILSPLLLLLLCLFQEALEDRELKVKEDTQEAQGLSDLL